MRRLLAAAGAAALSLAVVVPAAHAVGSVPDGGNHKLQWYVPYDMQGRAHPELATAPDNAVVYSTDEVVTARADFIDGVKSWDVIIQPVAGGAPSTCHEDISPQNNEYPSTVYINCPWDTTRIVDRKLDKPTSFGDAGDKNLQRPWHLYDHGASPNGKYTIEVTVVNAGQQGGLLTPNIPPDQRFTLFEDPTANPPRLRQVWVNNDVASPTGVNATFDPGAARINVTWAPNPEPDASYLLQEKIGDGKWGAPVSVPGNTTNYVRAIDQPGKYQYQVAAVRPAPTADSGSGASATKTSNYVAAQAVNVAQVTPPTTAAGPNGADGSIDHSGDNGVTMPTDAAPNSGPGAPASASANGKPQAGGSRPSSGGGGSRSGPLAGRSGSTGSTAGAGGEAEGEGPDSGFSASLPYQTADGSTDGLGSGDESPETMGPGFVKVPKPQDARAVLVPLAGALAVFMLAMQLMVWVRRRPAMVTATSDDFDDWMTY